MNSRQTYRDGSKDFQKRGEGRCTVYKPSWLDNKEDFSFHMVQKGQNNARNYKFIAKYFHQYFQIFSIFISSEGLPMIFTNALIKKTEETLIEQSMRKEKLRIARLSFIVGCFIKSFKMIINQFFFVSQAHLQRSFCFLLSEWRKKHQKGKLGTTNSYW